MDRLTDRLAEFLNPAQAQTVFVAADWPRFAELYRSQRPTGLFDAVLAGLGTTHTKQPPRSDTAQSHARPDLSPRDWLAARICDVLRLPPGQLAPDTPLPLLGLDSLLAMEIRGLIERELGVTIALADLLGNHSLNDLAERLEGDLPAGTTSPHPQTAWIAGQI